MVKLSLFLVFSLMLSNPVFSQSKEIVASFGESLPPWVIEEGPTGILVNLLQDCLEPAGYKLTPKTLPYARRIAEYQTDQVSVVTDINEKTIAERGLKGYYTGDIYAYENFLFSLSERALKVNKIADLAEYSLLSWQGAIAHIGGEYAAMATQNKKYSETHNQKTQLRMLFSKRVDFIQMDGQIYQFYRQQLLNDNEFDETVAVDKSPLFGKSPNGFLFKSEAARDACVTNLKLIKEENKYKEILYFGD
jgi:polar amino acid transport system substrate-binding protein